MATQSEAALENGLIKTLIDNSYERVFIQEEENLKANFKVQLEKHNQKALALIGRAQFTDKEFEKILIYLEGGTRFEKAKKLRDLYPLETEDGQRIWVEFLNQRKWCQNEFQVSNQITIEGRKKCRYDVTILVNGLPLVQIELKKRGVKKLKVVYSTEQPVEQQEDMSISCRKNCICPPGAKHKCTERRDIPGSVAFVPSVAGLIIAGEVVKDLCTI